MVEFALIVPILLVLFVAVADFGRIFATMIAVESATRDAAEAAANDYLANPPGPLSAPAPTGNPTFYSTLHDSAAQVVCAELRALPNTNYDAGTNTCPDMPAVLVCVHDGQDPGCGTAAQPGGAIPTDCSDFAPAPTNDQEGTAQRWVEVRTCYHFTPLLNVAFFHLGEFWVQRSRDFTIPCYFVLGTSECG
jgi:TadE-like protein